MSATDEKSTTEVRIMRKRRVFSERYKVRILEQFDACSVLGDKGELLRKEGLYSSTVSRWRQQMAKKTKPSRGRPKKSAVQTENEELRRRIEELEGRLHRAETIIEVQKKLSMLLEPLSPPTSDSEDSK
jgi:transposase